MSVLNWVLVNNSGQERNTFSPLVTVHSWSGTRVLSKVPLSVVTKLQLMPRVARHRQHPGQPTPF